jgi:peptidoglycan/LPS O-acetylase OafA/YrhL
MEIRKLNSLRGFAAIIVIVSHYSNRTNLLNSILGSGAGQIGVMLFFILSGFLMSYLYINKDFSKENVSKFVIARIARVVPLFLIIVVSSYVLNLLGISGIFYDIPNKVRFLLHAGFIWGTAVLWTIPVEIQFYAMFVCFWRLKSKKCSQMYLLITAIFIAVVTLGFPVKFVNILGETFALNLFRSLPYFFAGMVFGHLYSRWTPPAYLVKTYSPLLY